MKLTSSRPITPHLSLLLAVSLILILPGHRAWSDGPQDNHAESVRRVPRLGIEVSDKDRAELQNGLDQLGKRLAALRSLKNSRLKHLIPDVSVFHRAVRVALEFQEFFAQADIEGGKRMLAVGIERADALLAGKAPWTEQTGLVVRGYVSRIDGTVQPYGLVIPKSYATGGRPVRLDVWFHGRGETLSEVKFLDQRSRTVGSYAPHNTIVLHPYGRYSNAFKFAGEVDVLESLEAVRRHYRIDNNRIAMRGFSMGGAACWQFAVHYADRWFAANPGAGFSETPEFLKFFQKETLNPTWYERKLWHLYDCTDYAINLYHCPTVAYSGELDIQKQAADIMEEALEREGIDLTHIIGPRTKHSIHPESKKLIEQRMDSLAVRGRQTMPRTVHLVTYTLKYDRMHWVRVDSMGEHWEQARVDAVIQGNRRVKVTTQNVTELTLSMPSGTCPLEITQSPELVIDHQTIEVPRPGSDRSWACPLHQVDGKWRVGAASITGLRKQHNLQGPIDDALMDSFVFVRPTGKSKHPRVEAWTRSELEHAIVHWRRHFRGDARVKDDRSITEQDITSSNLILFGDPTSNSVLARLVNKLPIVWNSDSVVVGKRHFSAEQHAPVLVYPNPLNPKRYVVLNSGFTYREYAYLNNARQVPMLPDWAIVDLSVPAGSQYPGKIVAADFFGESWELRSPRRK